MICDGFCDRVKWLLEYRTFATPLLSSPLDVAFAFLFRVTTVITSEIFLRETYFDTPERAHDPSFPHVQIRT